MQHILFITLSNIGDAIMTTPTLERLHQLYPEATIDLVCDPRSAQLFEHCPYRGEIFLKLKKQGKKGLLKLIGRLRKKRYDLIVDLRTDGLAWLLKGKKRLTKWGHEAYGPHAVEDLISIIDKINPDKVIPDCRIWLGPEETENASQLLKDLPTENRLCIGPGANWPGKIWAAESFAEMTNQLKDIIDGVVIMGGPSDREYTEKTASLIDLPLIDLSGKTNLLTAAAVMKQCRLFIGNDSGLGHMASAVGTASVTVFGPGKPHRYHPWGKNNQWLRGENESLDKLQPETVSQQARQLLT